MQRTVIATTESMMMMIDGLHRVSLAIKILKHVQQRTWNGKRIPQSNFHLLLNETGEKKTNRTNWRPSILKMDKYAWKLTCKLFGLFIFHLNFVCIQNLFLYLIKNVRSILWFHLDRISEHIEPRQPSVYYLYTYISHSVVCFFRYKEVYGRQITRHDTTWGEIIKTNTKPFRKTRWWWLKKT